MAYTKQALLQEYLKQLRDYLGQLREDTYGFDEGQFKRIYSEIKKYINNPQLQDITQLKSIHHDFNKTLEEALKVNLVENKKSRLRSGKSSTDSITNESLGIGEFEQIIKSLEEKIDKVDVHQLNVKETAKETAKETPKESTKSTLSQKVAQVIEPRATTSATMQYSREGEPMYYDSRPSFKENLPTPSSTASKKIKKPKTYTQQQNERIEKERVENDLKFLESAIKHYKEFVKADNKFKDKHDGQDVKLALSSFAKQIREMTGMADRVARLSLNAKERKQLTERVKAMNEDRSVLLAHNEYTNIKEKGLVDIYSKYENRLNDYANGEQIPAVIQEMNETLARMNRLIKSHEMVAKNQPNLLGKYHQNLINHVRNERNDMMNYIGKWQDNQAQYRLATELSNQIEALKTRLQPAMPAKGVLSDKALEKQKKILLDKLNKLEKPEAAYNSKDRAVKLKKLKHELDDFEKQYKNIEQYYANTKGLYVQADAFRERYLQNKIVVSKKIGSELKSAYADFMKDNFEKPMIQINDPGNFSDPTQTTDFDNLHGKINQLQRTVRQFDFFFLNAANAVSGLSKVESQIKIKLTRDTTKSGGDELRDVRKRLAEDCLRANQEAKQLILKPLANPAELAQKLSSSKNINSIYVNEYKNIISMHQAEIDNAHNALNAASKAFGVLNKFQAMLPAAEGKYKNIVPEGARLIALMKEQIISILDKRPISETAVADIDMIMHENKNNVMLFRDVKWMAEQGDQHVRQLMYVVGNEIKMLKGGVQLLKEAREPKSDIAAMEAEIREYEIRLERLERLNENPKLHISNVLKNEIQDIRAMVAEKIFKNAYKRIEAYAELADKGVLSQYELIDLKRYLAEGKLQEAYFELFSNSTSPFIKEHKGEFIKRFFQLVDKVEEDKLYIVDQATIKKVIDHEVPVKKVEKHEQVVTVADNAKADILKSPAAESIYSKAGSSVLFKREHRETVKPLEDKPINRGGPSNKSNG